MRRARLWWFPALLVALLALPGMSRAVTVSVPPPEVYNAPDLEALAPGLQAALASRLSGEGYSVVTTKGAPAGGGDWVVTTTITRVGNVYSVDAALEPVTGKGEGARAFQTANSVDAILPALESVAAKLKKALGKPPVAAAPSPAPPPPEAAEAPKAPPPARGTAPVLASTPQPSMDALLGQALGAHRLGPKLTGEAQALAVADVDGDGVPEILVLMDREILAYHDENGTFSLVWKAKGPAGLTPLLLSAADIDGNGLPEVFVAGMDGTTPMSQAYQWSGSTLVPQGDRIYALVRAVVHPERGPLLLGMEAGGGDALFSTEVRSFVWSDGQYRAADPIPVPESAAGFNIDWHRLAPGSSPFGVVVTQWDHIRIYDGSKLRFEGSDVVKGTVALVMGPRDVYDLPTETRKLQGRTVSWEAPNGATYLILQKNYASVSRAFQRSASFSEGQLLAFRWDGVTLLSAAKGPKIPGFIADLDLAFYPEADRTNQPPRRATLYCLWVQKEGLIFSKRTTQLLAYDLPAPRH